MMQAATRYDSPRTTTMYKQSQQQQRRGPIANCIFSSKQASQSSVSQIHII
jgi:hypothetical protein